MQLKKSEQGFIAKANGLNVPNIDEKSCDRFIELRRDFIGRSESPWEMYSGMFNSPTVKLSDRHLDEETGEPKFLIKGVVSTLFDGKKDQFYEKNECEIENAAAFLGLSEKEVRDQLSFSYWELLGGSNCAMVRDSGISNRYHFMVLNSFKSKGYCVIEDGEVIYDDDNESFIESLDWFRRDVGFYNQVCEAFQTDKNPLVEYQRFNGKNYFLQYLDTNPTVTCEPFLRGYKPKKGEFVLPWSRGVTTEEGIETSLIFERELDFDRKSEILDFLERNSNKNSVSVNEYFCRSSGVYETIFEKIKSAVYRTNHFGLGSHFDRNILFKPELTVQVPYKDEYGLLNDRLDANEPINLRSDGRTTIARLL